MYRFILPFSDLPGDPLQMSPQTKITADGAGQVLGLLPISDFEALARYRTGLRYAPTAEGTARALGRLVSERLAQLDQRPTAPADTGETHSTRAVRWHLADSYYAPQSVAQIAEGTRLAQPTIGLAVRRLQALGFVTMAPIRTGGDSGRYVTGHKLTTAGIAQSAKDHPIDEQRAFLDEELLTAVGGK